MPPRLRRPAPWLAAAGVAVLAVVVWRVRGPAEPEVYPPARVLKFPEVVPEGSTYRLFTSDAPKSISGFPSISGMEEQAFGEMPVPRGMWSTLVIIQRGWPTNDYSFLQDLGEDDLQGIIIMPGIGSLKMAIREDRLVPAPPWRAATLVEHIKHLSGLRFLAIESFDGDNKALKHLAELDQLFWLNIGISNVTESDLNRLRAALPNCIINGVKGVPGPENRRPIG